MIINNIRVNIIITTNISNIRVNAIFTIIIRVNITNYTIITTDGADTLSIKSRILRNSGVFTQKYRSLKSRIFGKYRRYSPKCGLFGLK